MINIFFCLRRNLLQVLSFYLKEKLCLHNSIPELIEKSTRRKSSKKAAHF